MKVKCIVKYFDRELKRGINVGEVLTVSEARGRALTSAENASGIVLCEKIAEETQEAKKPRKKKED